MSVYICGDEKINNAASSGYVSTISIMLGMVLLRKEFTNFELNWLDSKFFGFYLNFSLTFSHWRWENDCLLQKLSLNSRNGAQCMANMHRGVKKNQKLIVFHYIHSRGKRGTRSILDDDNAESSQNIVTFILISRCVFGILLTVYTWPLNIDCSVFFCFVPTTLLLSKYTW